MSEEQKIRSFAKVEDHIKRILSIIDKHTVMISELENKYIENYNRMGTNKLMIAELEKKYESILSSRSVWLTGIKTEIAELRDDIKTLYECDSKDSQNINELKEVLRELKREMISPILYQLWDKKLIDSDDYGKIYDKGIIIEKKLEGKHDCYKSWTRNIKVHDLDELEGKKEYPGVKEYCDFMDSGGEKEYKGHLMQKTDIIADSDVGAIDSKPAEPKIDCSKCKFVKGNTDICVKCIDDGYSYYEPRENEFFYLPDMDAPGAIFSDGFMEYIKKAYIKLFPNEPPVKREDLQWLYSLNFGEGIRKRSEMENLQRIKEEYGIE